MTKRLGPRFRWDDDGFFNNSALLSALDSNSMPDQSFGTYPRFGASQRSVSVTDMPLRAA